MTGVRADGYHVIDAEMVTLGLADELTITARDHDAGSSISVSGPFSAGVPTDRTNLVSRALAAVGRCADVEVDKHVPHGGGLGGGSADAAAVLRWSGVTDLDIAVGLGADVPFCLLGGRARVTGIGEHVEPLAPIGRMVTLVVPPLHVSTPAVYAAWDRLGGPHVDGPNDLEPAALAVAPALNLWRERIVERCGHVPTLAGSGSTWFVPGDHATTLSALEGDGATVIVTTA